MNTQLGMLTLFFYAASLGCYVRFLYVNKPAIGRAATLCLAIGIVLHYFTMLERARLIHSVPYQDLNGAVSLFGWLLAITYLGLELFHRQRSVGPFVLPFVIGLFLVVSFEPGTTSPTPPPAHGPLFAFHVTLNILAYSAFTLAFVLSVIYLLQNHLLRDRRLSNVFWRFPALEVLDRMSRSSVVVGMLALSVGMTLGFIWAHRIRGNYWNGDAKEIITLVIFVSYALYLWLSRRPAWRGARASWLCAICFVIPIFSITVVNLYLSHYHRYF
jgi:ABC-type transport system involved in cytochrome c biogenesis permease subunit